VLVPIDRGRPHDVEWIEPLVVNRSVKVLLVLTPDNYAENVLPLIRTAKSTLYFQNQYIAIAKQIPQAFSNLLDALLERARTLGEGFRMILRDIGDVRTMLEVLEARGFDLATQVKVQKATHTKGIIVDSRRVLVGSHNWSGPGTTRNRDASLLFDDEEIARYFERAFLHDWTNLASTKVAGELRMPRVITKGERSDEAVPDGFEAVPWSSYYED